ncbi:MAG: hypothetical protein PUD51_09420 [Prevotellaceae bacterium]|nr:hypothetical protein [Prevotellaceae bacterium]
MKTIQVLLVIALLSTTCCLNAQTFAGDRNFDGLHKNEVQGYLQSGDNIITGFFIGMTGVYTRHFDKHWSVRGGAHYQVQKGLFGFSGEGVYHFSKGYSDFYLSAKAFYNRYDKYKTDEYNANVSLTWQTPYFDLTVGESFITYNLLASTYTEPLTLTFGTGVNIRPRWEKWNVGAFFRNYDEFYYENWNINWGFRGMGTLADNLKLLAELNIRPAGSMSQLASKYETTVKIGLKYVW